MGEANQAFMAWRSVGGGKARVEVWRIRGVSVGSGHVWTGFVGGGLRAGCGEYCDRQY